VQAVGQDTLSSTVVIDDVLLAACSPFDYDFDGTSTFTLPRFNAPKRDGTWSIGLIVGPSGSGKTQLLKRHYGVTQPKEWLSEKAIASHFGDSQNAIERLTAVGLNSVPSWCKPFHVLSNGEQFRAAIAASIESETAFDEFSSVVDRTVAKSASHALQRYIRQSAMTGVVFASCHRDIAEWLLPDWTFDTLTGEMSSRGSLQRPRISIDVDKCSRAWWQTFRHHHYLTGEMNAAAECYLAKWNGETVAFSCCLSMPIGTVKNAWREHRTVVLPDYQGLGIGVRLSDYVAQKNVDRGRRYFSKTAHPRMGEYRTRSQLWKPTSKNGLSREFNGKGVYNGLHKTLRVGKQCFSHEYVGAG
jgi:GNAT superfamily N-acetyltransferase